MRMFACFLASIDGPYPGMRDKISFNKNREKYTRRLRDERYNKLQSELLTKYSWHMFDDEHVKI